MPPSRLWTTCVRREGITFPLPRLTSSRMAKCAHPRNTASNAMEVKRSMRDVRGVRSSAAARMSLANAKSDCDTGLHGSRRTRGRWNRRWRSLLRGLGWGDWRRLVGIALEQGQNLVARAIGDEAPAIKQQQAV